MQAPTDACRLLAVLYRQSRRITIIRAGLDFLYLLTKIRTQSEGAIVIQFLMASPTHRISHAFHFNLGLKTCSLPLCSFRQHELRLPDLSGKRVAGIEAAACEHSAVLA